jgi:hypothetical protein
MIIMGPGMYLNLTVPLPPRHKLGEFDYGQRSSADGTGASPKPRARTREATAGR